MKLTVGRFFTAVVCCSFLLAIPHAGAKSRTDLPPFKGNYPGVATLAGGNSFSGTAQTSFKIVRKGRTALVTVAYTLTINGTPTSFVETYNLQSGGVCVLNEAVPADSKSDVSSVTYTARSKVITFTGTFEEGGPGTISGSMRVKVRKHRQFLTIIHTGSVPGSFTATFTFQGSHRVRK